MERAERASDEWPGALTHLPCSATDALLWQTTVSGRFQVRSIQSLRRRCEGPRRIWLETTFLRLSSYSGANYNIMLLRHRADGSVNASHFRESVAQAHVASNTWQAPDRPGFWQMVKVRRSRVMLRARPTQDSIGGGDELFLQHNLGVPAKTYNFLQVPDIRLGRVFSTGSGGVARTRMCVSDDGVFMATTVTWLACPRHALPRTRARPEV